MSVQKKAKISNLTILCVVTRKMQNKYYLKNYVTSKHNVICNERRNVTTNRKNCDYYATSTVIRPVSGLFWCSKFLFQARLRKNYEVTQRIISISVGHLYNVHSTITQKLFHVLTVIQPTNTIRVTLNKTYTVTAAIVMSRLLLE